MHRKISIPTRCYIFIKSNERYYLFDLIKRFTDKIFSCYYQCGQDLKAILTDMDSKQISGKIKHAISTLLILY